MPAVETHFVVLQGLIEILVRVCTTGSFLKANLRCLKGFSQSGLAGSGRADAVLFPVLMLCLMRLARIGCGLLASADL